MWRTGLKMQSIADFLLWLLAEALNNVGVEVPHILMYIFL